jgi:deoxycytidylate deaminase
MKTHEDYFILAGEEAKKSLCLRDVTGDKCGAVIVLHGEIVGRGYNAPPGDDVTQRRCHLEPKSDRTCCLHAEWRAILDAVAHGKAKGATLYFVRVDSEGNVKYTSGAPYCTVCSRLALDTGIAYFALRMKEGAKLWDTKSYNDISYAFHEKSNQ